MPRPTLKEQRAAIGGALRALPQINVYERWPNNIQTPAALVRPAKRRQSAFGDMLDFEWEIEVLVAALDNESSQVELDEYLDEEGERSVRAALEFDPTLGGVVDSSWYNGWEKYGGRLGEAISFIGAIVLFETSI